MRTVSARRTLWERTAAYFCGQMGLFTLSILTVALCTPLHIFLHERLDTARKLGLTDNALRDIAHAMTSAMRGEGYDALSRFFNANEVSHMRDVRGLITLAWRVFAGFTVLYAVGMAKTRGMRRAIHSVAARNALCLCAVLVAGIALCFRIDFYGSFLVFHRVFFPGNELWLMDPAVDFMVVVYDQGFFIWAAACAGGLCLVSLAPLTVCWLRGGEASK